MKVKLTLYVDDAAVRRGKSWARRRRQPLSSLVEEHFNRMATPGGDRFLAKWRGRFALPADVKSDARATAILAKHGPVE